MGFMLCQQALNIGRLLLVPHALKGFCFCLVKTDDVVSSNGSFTAFAAAFAVLFIIEDGILPFQVFQCADNRFDITRLLILAPIILFTLCWNQAQNRKQPFRSILLLYER